MIQSNSQIFPTLITVFSMVFIAWVCPLTEVVCQIHNLTFIDFAEARCGRIDYYTTTQQKYVLQVDWRVYFYYERGETANWEVLRWHRARAELRSAALGEKIFFFLLFFFFWRIGIGLWAQLYLLYFFVLLYIGPSWLLFAYILLGPNNPNFGQLLLLVLNWSIFTFQLLVLNWTNF